MLDEEKKEKLGFLPKRSFYNGLSMFLAIAASILFYLLISRIDVIFSAVKTVIGVLTPVILGLVIAYLINPLVNFLRKHTFKLFSKWFKKEKIILIFSKSVSVAGGILFLLLILFVICWLIIPNLIKSVTNLVEQVTDNYSVYAEKIDRVLVNNEKLKQLVDQGISAFNNWVNNDLLANMTKLAETVYTSALGVIKFLTDFLIGIMVSIYILYNKDLFKAQTKKILHAFAKEETVATVIDSTQKVDKIFGGFIIGKIIDSFIIGVLCFIGTTLLGFNSTSVLVSTIVGITNIIPVFGPFIGGVPSALIIWVAEGDIKKALYFAIFIIFLQQLDGNIIGPKILGDKTGLSAFWVIVAITVFGGFFGIFGMLIGVPTFAVIYFAFSSFIRKKLRKRGLPESTVDYGLKSEITVDEEKDKTKGK